MSKRRKQPSGKRLEELKYVNSVTGVCKQVSPQNMSVDTASAVYGVLMDHLRRIRDFKSIDGMTAWRPVKKRANNERGYTIHLQVLVDDEWRTVLMIQSRYRYWETLNKLLEGDDILDS